MRRSAITGMVVVAVAALIGTGALASGSTATGSAADTRGTLHVIEHAVTDRVHDVGKKGDSAGDLLTFHNPVFGPRNRTQVGRDQGSCIRIAPGEGTWECAWTTFTKDGHITVEGPFNDNHDTVVSITGGTGSWRNIRGAMLLKSRAGGTQFDFIFRWIK
jgi:hypothetical protein